MQPLHVGSGSCGQPTDVERVRLWLLPCRCDSRGEFTVAPSSSAFASESRIEDVLAHLPMSTITECGRGQVIYGPEHPSSSIYLLIAGKVRISQFAADRTEVLLDIIRPEEIFGESAFLDSRG